MRALVGLVALAACPLIYVWLTQPHYLIVSVVRDEAHAVGRLRASVERALWYTRVAWLVCDTGSADGTLEIVSGWANTRVVKHEWVHFEHNRNACLEEARRMELGPRVYYWLLDADYALERAPPKLELFWGWPAYDANMVSIRAEPLNALPLLLSHRALHACRYRLWTHELLECTDEPKGFVSWGYLEGAHVVDHRDGASRAGKFERDARLLERWLELHISDDDDHLVARALFYLAQSYEGTANGTERALVTYERHLAVERAHNYRYMARFRLALLRENATALLECATREPDGLFRWEPWYYLARQARLAANYGECLMYTSAALGAPPVRMERNPLFLQGAIYEWALREERAYCFHHAGYAREARREYERILGDGLVRSPNAEAQTRALHYVKAQSGTP
jgi:glycosyltransferase involved in cell wall biosynthesis